MGAATVKEEMRAIASPQVEGVKADEKSDATFEFCMEELYRKLFQAEESPERENTSLTRCTRSAAVMSGICNPLPSARSAAA